MSTRSPSSSRKKWWCSLGIGVEIGPGAVDRELAQEPGFRELVQGVVDGRERDRHAGPARLVEQHFGGDMPVALAEQQPAEGNPLPGRTQADPAQLVAQFGQRAAAPCSGADVDSM